MTVRLNEIEYPGDDLYDHSTLEQVGTQRIPAIEPILKATELAYLIWEKPDLDKTQSFMKDFGLSLAQKSENDLYLRASGPSPYCFWARKGDKSRYLGAAFTVESLKTLEQVASSTGSDIKAIEGPGGGCRCRLHDPDGFIVDLVAEREQRAEAKLRAELPELNTPWEKKRVNLTQRPQLQPAQVARMGHVVIQVTNFALSQDWYMRHLGITPTDVLCLEDGTPALAFNRLDLGNIPSDHHTLVIAQGPKAKYLHSAYEVLDIDSLGQGQQFLKMQGWQHFWGIGRHILGSQLFDYWLDPEGAEFEHYADGDVFDNSYPTGYHLLDRGGLWQWGHDLPPSMKPRPGFKDTVQLIADIARKRVNLRQVKLMMKALGRRPRPWLD